MKSRIHYNKWIINSKMSFTLLSTKLYFPPARSKLVSRARLVELVKAGLQGPLTLISAPVGYGKTTLISEWRSVAGRKFAAAWLSIDSGDNELARFLIYLTAAFETIERGLVRNTASLLNTPQLPPVDAILTALINDLENFDQDIALVLDDYQEIKEPTIHEALTFLLNHCPARLHLILLTRADPPLPLGRLRVRNQLVEIRADDLRFTADEIEAFLTNVMGVRISTEEAGVLEARTEGWIAGLQLAGLSIQGREDVPGFVAKFSGSHHYVVDYMVEEVLNQQPVPIREFLLQTSILERMNAGLCDSLTQRTDSQTLLESLERANLFIIPLDGERRWYRYHHFFADLLRGRLQHLQPDLVPEYHRRASVWYQTNGYIAEALEHALSGNHYEEAALIVENTGNDMLATGAWGPLLNWLRMFPSKIIQAHPSLEIFYTWGLVLTGQLDDVDKRLKNIEEAMAEHHSEKQQMDPNLHWQIQAVRSRVAYLRGDFHQAIELASEALISLDTHELTARGILGITLGSSYLLAGDLGRASHTLEETRKVNQQAGNRIFAIDAAGTLAQILEAQGYLRRAAETYQEIIRLSVESKDPNVMAAYLNLGNVLYEWNDLNGAEDKFKTCFEIAEKIYAPDGRLYALLGLVRVKEARDDHQGAIELAQQAENAMQNFTQSILGRHAAASLAKIALTHGDLQKAERWAAGREIPADKILPVNLFLLKVEYLALAYLLILKDKLAEAEQFLEKLYGVAKSTGLTGSQIEILALMALARSRQGNNTGAMQALAQALERAEPEGQLRTFVDLGEPIKDLLQQAVRRSVRDDYAFKVLAAMSAVENNMSGRQDRVAPLIEPLTERELEVLRLLALGKSNKEIAQDLVLATGTVKKHLNNIYSKLGVNNRMQCVKRGQEMKLF